MERFDKAVAFLSRFVSIVLYELDTEHADELASIGIPVNAKGTYTGIIYIKHTGNEDQMIKTLVHEFGHFLVDLGLLSKEEVNPNYFSKVDTRWLSTYPVEDRPEEQLVESFALWAMDSINGKINPDFWACLKSKLQQI